MPPRLVQRWPHSSQTLSYDELDRLKTIASTVDNENYNYNDGNRIHL